MKKLFILTLLLLAATTALALRRGWFQVSSTPDGDKTNINLSVDKAKLHDDESKVIEKAHHVTEKAADLTKHGS